MALKVRPDARTHRLISHILYRCEFQPTHVINGYGSLLYVRVLKDLLTCLKQTNCTRVALDLLDLRIPKFAKLIFVKNSGKLSRSQVSQHARDVLLVVRQRTVSLGIIISASVTTRSDRIR